MATTPSKDDGAKTPDPKTPVATPVEPAADSQQENASKLVGYRGDQVSAADAAAEANKQVEKEQADAIKNAVPVDQAAFAPTYGNQVPQEGALVESPPQPVPPAYSDAELKEMDHAPLGLREPSIAKDSTDTDQTVHPASRVNDPSKPL